MTQEKLDKFWKGKDFYMKLSQKQEPDEEAGQCLQEYMGECIEYERILNMKESVLEEIGL